MIQIIDDKECCGCAVCSVVCPVACISMEKGKLGHMFPSIDKNKCIECRKCESVCPEKIPIRSRQMAEQAAYAAYAKDPDIRFAGSSGGIFEIFARKLLSEGYIVYGAAFDDNLQLKCTKAETQEELKPLLKSKYLQSELSEKYMEIREQLNSGRKILFVSTPCQVAALKIYLSKEYNNLITVDFFCHGVPSQEFFDKCRRYVENKRKIKITNFQFRVKKMNGACPHYYQMDYIKEGRKKTEVKLYFHSIFYAAFQRYINLRESCYDCRFAGKNRVSDITIGDFHEIDRYVRGLNRFEGVSTVIVNTSIGNKLWEECSDKLQMIKMKLEQLEKDGICFEKGTKRPAMRDEFLGDYENASFEVLALKWMNPKKYWKQEIYYSMPRGLREKIKKYVYGGGYSG